jgi:hypothetical protein
LGQTGSGSDMIISDQDRQKFSATAGSGPTTLALKRLLFEYEGWVTVHHLIPLSSRNLCVTKKNFGNQPPSCYSEKLNKICLIDNIFYIVTTCLNVIAHSIVPVLRIWTDLDRIRIRPPRTDWIWIQPKPDPDSSK